MGSGLEVGAEGRITEWQSEALSHSFAVEADSKNTFILDGLEKVADPNLRDKRKVEVNFYAQTSISSSNVVDGARVNL